MQIERLNENHGNKYLAYLKKALAEEPDMMTIECVDEPGIVKRIQSHDNQQAVSLLAFENDQIVGRLEYHFYSCLQDGYKMAYVSWVYVLKEYRRRGIARALFSAFEAECREHDIDQYYLIQAQNESAARFYASFAGAQSCDERILRKTLK